MQGFAGAGGLCARQARKTRQTPVTVESDAPGARRRRPQTIKPPDWREPGGRTRSSHRAGSRAANKYSRRESPPRPAPLPRGRGAEEPAYKIATETPKRENFARAQQHFERIRQFIASLKSFLCASIISDYAPLVNPQRQILPFDQQSFSAFICKSDFDPALPQTRPLNGHISALVL